MKITKYILPKTVRIVVLVLLLSPPGWAQQRPLSVGDTLPDLTLKMGGYLQDEAEIRSFRGKWLILDFWESFCAPCIQSLPKLDSLQQQFGTTVQILPVTAGTWANVENTQARLLKGHKIRLPFVVEDKSLKRLFPHRIIPHTIWIDPQGIVRSMTDGNQFTAANFSALSKGGLPGMDQKKDELGWSINKPLGGLTLPDSAIVYRSILTKYNPSAPSGSSFSPLNKNLPPGTRDHVYFFNMMPIQMYYIAFMRLVWGGGTNVNPHRIIIEIKDPKIRMRYANDTLSPFPFGSFRFPFMDWKDRRAFNRDHVFSYDFQLPVPVADSVLLRYLYEDFNRLFPIKGRVELRETECLVITCPDTVKAQTLLASKERGPFKWVLSTYKSGGYNGTLDEFIRSEINTFAIAPPVLNETGLTGPVDIVLDFSASKLVNPEWGVVVNSPLDEAVFKSELRRYGLDLVRTRRTVPMLVISD